MAGIAGIQHRWLLVLAVLLSSSLAGADSVKEAKQYFAAGQEAYEAGRFGTAAEAFEHAYELYPQPQIAFSMAQAYRRRYFESDDPAHLRRALELYRLYLREVPQGTSRGIAVEHIAELQPLWEKVDAARRQGLETRAPPKPTELMVSSKTPGARAAVGDGELSEVPLVAAVEPGKYRVRIEAPGYRSEVLDAIAIEERLVLVRADLEPLPAKLTLQIPAGARAALGGRAVDRSVLSDPVALPAGRHLITVRKRGYEPFVRTITLARGQERTLAVPLRRTRQRVASYYVGAGAGGLAIAGLTTGLLARREQGRAQEIFDRVGHEPLAGAERDAYNDHLDRRNSLRAVAYVLGGGAVVTAAVAAALYWFDDASPEAPPEGWQLVPTASDEGAGVSLGARF